MLQRTAPKATNIAQAIALPFDGEESFAGVSVGQTPRSSLYTLAVAVRVGFVVAILLKALAIWQW